MMAVDPLPPPPTFAGRSQSRYTTCQYCRVPNRLSGRLLRCGACGAPLLSEPDPEKHKPRYFVDGNPFISMQEAAEAIQAMGLSFQEASHSMDALRYAMADNDRRADVISDTGYPELWMDGKLWPPSDTGGEDYR